MTRPASDSTRASADWADWLDSYEGLPASPEPALSRPAPSPTYRWLEQSATALPGLALAVLLAGVATVAADLTGRRVLGFARSPIGAIPVAIVFGALLRNFGGVPKAYEAGLKLSVRVLLRFGIVLLGLRLSLGAVGAIGLAGIPLVAVCIAAAFAAVLLLARLLGISAKQSQLIAAGTGICGVSAIAAVAPLIEADDDEVSYSIACVTLFGLVAMFTYPWLAYVLFDGDAQRAGYFLGTSIHDTAQVTGAAMMYRQQYDAAAALDVATVTKLLRNTTMALLIPLIGLAAHAKGKKKMRLSQSVPLFVIAYLGMALLRTIGDATWSSPDWKALLALADAGSAWLLAAAMAAVGLGTDVSRIRRLGWRPMIAGLVAAVAVGAVSFAMLRLP